MSHLVSQLFVRYLARWHNGQANKISDAYRRPAISTSGHLPSTQERCSRLETYTGVFIVRCGLQSEDHLRDTGHRFHSVNGMAVRLCFCDRLEQRVEGAGLHAPQVRFEFGKCHFNRVQVRAVRRQEEKPVSLRLQERLCDCGFM